MRKLLATWLLLCGSYAVAQIPVPNCTINTWGAGTNGSVPTIANVTSSTSGATPATVIINGGTNITTDTASAQVPWLITPTCATPVASTLGLTYTVGSPNNDVTVEFAGGPNGSASQSTPFYSDIPQNAGCPGGFQYYDIIDIIVSASTSGGFVNYQIGGCFNPGVENDWFMECGGCAGGGGSASNRNVPTNTWQVVNQYMHNGLMYQGVWTQSTGLFNAGSLASAISSGTGSVAVSSFTGTSGTLTFTTATQSFTNGELVLLSGFTGGNTGLNGQSVTVLSTGLSSTQFEAVVAGSGYSSGSGDVGKPFQPFGYYVGDGVGNGFPSGDHLRFGSMISCGYTSSETVCPFPLAPGLQRLPPSISLAGGSYSSPQSGITLSDLDGLGTIYYTLDGSMPSCALGANDVIGTCHGTQYSGSLPELFITTTVNAIDCKSNYQCSTVTTATYTITPGGGFLPADRAIDFTQAGACPGALGATPDQGCIPGAALTWTQVGSTIAACGSSGSPVTPTACGITSALLSSCTGGAYILLAGTTSSPADFYLTSSISVPSNCEIMGGGPTATRLHISGAGGCNPGAFFFCLQGSNNYTNGEQNYATWASGYSQGSTSITISNCNGGTCGTTNIVAGKTTIALDQLDATSDTGQIWPCVLSACGSANSSGAPRTDHTCSGGYCSQVQYVLVVSCSPTNCTNSSGAVTLNISPAIYAKNWASGNSPGAWWATTVVQQPGLSNLLVDMTNATNGTSPIAVNNAYEPFIYNVATGPGARNHVNVQYTKNATVISTYGFGEQTGFLGTSSYALECNDCADSFIANNIYQQVVTGPTNTGGAGGNVIACNFFASSIANSTGFMTQGQFDHAGGNLYDLRECNIDFGIQEDNTHGDHALFTHDRNFLPGWAPAFSCNGTACTTNTVSDFIYGGSRYGNVFANVVGQSGYHTSGGQLYFTPSSGTCGNSTWKILFLVGCGESGAAFFANPATGGSTVSYDPLAASSLILLDNFDVITGAACTGVNTPVSGCQASTASSFDDSTGSPSVYAGLASPGTIPPSMAFAGNPWFEGTIPFPPIGPDVSSGNLLLCTSGTYSGSYVSNVSQCGTGGATSSAASGHVNMNAAMNCYLNVMNGPANGSGSMLSFNPAACYPFTSGSGPTTGPSSFSGLLSGGVIQ